METALKYEIEQAIPELTNNIYPTNAPEGHTRPYLVYMRIDTDIEKTLNGIGDAEAISYMFSVMASRYSDMVNYRGQIEKLLKGMVFTTIGDDQQFHITDLDFNGIHEVYEHGLRVNRGIIDFTIYFDVEETKEEEEE